MLLEFCFKGDRDYVHGTDIVNKFLHLFHGNEITDIDIRFNGITNNFLLLVEGNEQENPKVNIHLCINKEEKTYQLIEDDTHHVNCRYEYDEHAIIECTEIYENEQAITLKKPTGITLCENLVAMNKSLLETIYPDEVGKWYFTRLELKQVIDDDSLITVKLIKNFNFRLIKSDVLVNDELIGSVYFTLVKEDK